MAASCPSSDAPAREWAVSPAASADLGRAPRRDVSFYGNKLFQSTFIAIIAPGSSILTGLLWTLLNSFVALVRTSAPCNPKP